MNVEVALNHPSLYNDGIVIFIESDMPRLINKIINSLERFSLSEHDTDLHSHGHKLSLNMLHLLWFESGNNSGEFVRNVNMLTKDHFSKIVTQE